MTVPATMNCVEISTPGGPEVLKPAGRPTPQPAAGEVLVKVAAAGVNRPDVLQRYGKYPAPAGASDLPGLEIAGTVAALGEGVTQLRIGDAVCALVSGGGYAEYCTAPVPQCLPIPKGLSMVEAAAVPETFFTVWTNVFERGRLKAGEIFLCHGGASGIGTTAVQLAKAWGARVFATAGTDEKCAAVTKLGAERCINYKTEDYVAVIKDATKGDAKGEGTDLILDMVGGEYVGRNIQLARLEGRIVQIAFLKGPKTEVNLDPLMRKRLTLTGSTLRARSVAEKGVVAAQVKQNAWPLIEAGKVKPVIYKVFPLAEASEAHRLMEADTHIGKLVLKVD
jgi:NADPH2:quinone reductase